MIVHAVNAEAAKRLAQRTDEPVDTGPSTKPDRAAQGWRRYEWRDEPASEGIVNKVRKLLNLASNEGASEAEAAAAAAAAQRLIEKHRLDMALLDDQPVATARDEQIVTMDLCTGDRYVAWRGQLAAPLARINGCYAYGNGTIRVVGTADRCGHVRQMFTYLAHEIERLALVHATGRGRAYANAWRVGCVSRLIERVREAVAQGADDAKRAAVGRGVSLVRVEFAMSLTSSVRERERVEVWVKENLKLGKRRASPVRSDGYHAGRSAANGINLSAANRRALR